jgi:hypothetical protein
MNANEPIAWMHKTISSWVSTFIHPETEPDEWLPLYTHPAKKLTNDPLVNWKPVWQEKPELTLTDAEIKEVYGEYFDIENCDWLHLQCIQAILKKASEK